MPAPVRIGLIGNSFAARVQLPALRWAGGNRVVAICGRDRAKAERTAAAWNIPHSTDDWRDLLAQDLDLVCIATPVDLHAPIARAALDTGAAILCEKPFTLDAGEARELVDVGAGRLCLLDHQLRWSPWRRRLRALVDEGFLGEVWSARLAMRLGSARRITAPFNWWYDAARGGGALGAIGSHMLDALQLDLGPIAEVRAKLVTYRRERSDAEGRPRTVTADEHASLWLRTAGGAEICLEANVMAPGATGSAIEYVGSEGSARLEGEEHLHAARHGEDMLELAVDSEPPTCEELGIEEPGMFARTLPLYLRDVVGAVAAGASSLPGAATFADGLATMRVLDAARRSAADASWVPCR